MRYRFRNRAAFGTLNIGLILSGIAIFAVTDGWAHTLLVVLVLAAYTVAIGSEIAYRRRNAD